MDAALSKISAAKRALQQASTFDEVLEIRDKAEAIRTYLKASKESLEAQNAAADIRLRAERKIGEMLAEIERIGHRPNKGITLIPFSEKLNDLGITKNQSSRWQLAASVVEKEYCRLVDECNAKEVELTQAELLRIAKGKPHVSNNSGVEDWYTPEEFIESARIVLGEIDLDPASSEAAQQIVQAAKFYTKEENGLNQEWSGRVWMNPPYSAGLVEQFADKLVASLPNVPSAIVLVNNATDTRWFYALATASTAICFCRGRVKFLDVNGDPRGTPLQGQAFLYFGRSVKKFVKEFRQYGFCVEGITCE